VLPLLETLGDVVCGVEVDEITVGGLVDGGGVGVVSWVGGGAVGVVDVCGVVVLGVLGAVTVVVDSVVVTSVDVTGGTVVPLLFEPSCFLTKLTKLLAISASC
jgi:hypothetical protein